jgi:hypothetical protein
MASPPRPLSLVKLKPEFESRAVADKLPFAKDMPLIFLGEIPNMPEHGVFVGHSTGRFYSGYHISQFVELNEDEV